MHPLPIDHLHAIHDHRREQLMRSARPRYPRSEWFPWTTLLAALSLRAPSRSVAPTAADTAPCC